jgi:hypothetical protein
VDCRIDALVIDMGEGDVFDEKGTGAGSVAVTLVSSYSNRRIIRGDAGSVFISITTANSASIHKSACNFLFGFHLGVR